MLSIPKVEIGSRVIFDVPLILHEPSSRHTPKTSHTPLAIQNHSPGSCGNLPLESPGFVQTSPEQQLSTPWPIRYQGWVSLFCSQNSIFSMQLDMRRGARVWYGKECTAILGHMIRVVSSPSVLERLN